MSGVRLLSPEGARACAEYTPPTVPPEPVEQWCGHTYTDRGREYWLLAEECDQCAARGAA